MDITIGERLKKLRQSQGYTQREIADFLDVTPKALSFYELNQRQAPYNLLVKMSVKYGVTADYILTGSNEDSFYNNPETAALAQELKTHPEYRALLDSIRGLKESSLKEIMNFIKYQRTKEVE